ncbi:MAG: hypothetical protein A3H96_11250 [Acidobacteria bacterium RIFCSPLOWO2_02_FULL_67_36]|nr:MAG: hypothetical protein A3H96_11250 [Acidobacteria bacterium RIFCSPLOWO2_02_FULL_67_36]
MRTDPRLRVYGGTILTVDGQRVVQLVDPNDNARRRFQYRRTLDGTGIEQRTLRADGQPYTDTGSPWEPADVATMRRIRGDYHPILDSLGL